MRNFMFACCLAAVSLSINAQDAWHVSEEPSLRGVLLEEFTGIHCGYCPQGHAIASAMLTAQPEMMNVIAVHAGAFATPSAVEPDLRTDDGDRIHDAYEISGYPSGMISRVDFYDTGSPVCGRSSWTMYSRMLSTDTAEVNIWAHVNYDGSEQLLTVDVEGCFINDTIDYSEAKVSVALTQNNILGPQNGAFDGNNYHHNHVLRQYITNAFGDAISDKIENGKFRASYSLELPANWRGIASDPRELQVVVFVTNKAGNVLNARTYTPSYTNYMPRASYQLSDYKIEANATCYGYNFLDVNFRNISGAIVESATFTVSAGSEEEEVTLNDLSVAPMCTSTLRLPLGTLRPGDKDADYVVSLTSVNGKSASADALSLKLYQVPSVPTEIDVIIRPDNYASDNTWTLYDADYNTIVRFGPFSEGVTDEQTTRIQLEDGKTYCLEITDAWGDGILMPRGTVKAYDTNGELALQCLQIEGQGTRMFMRADKESNPSGIEAVASDEGKMLWYSIDGRCLGSDRGNLPAGIAIGRCGIKAVKVLIP